jgi:polar amino acid transport system substrate-binding protein
LGGLSWRVFRKDHRLTASSAGCTNIRPLCLSATLGGTLHRIDGGLFMSSFYTVRSIIGLYSLFFLFALSALGSTQADEVLGAFQTAKPPFIIPEPPYDDHDMGMNSEGLGIQIDVARAALKVRGHSLKHVFVSEKRLNHELNEGNVDIAFDVRPELSHRFYSKERFSEYENAVITHRLDSREINSFKDLSSISLVTWQGATKDLGPAFASVVKNNPGYLETPDTSKLKLFISGRVDSILIDKYIFSWYFKHVEKGINPAEMFHFHNLQELKIRGGKAGFISESLRNDFDFGLRTIRSNGVYQKIIDKYLF